MSDDENEEEEDAPAVELGEGPDVEGAPLSRVTARLTWGIEHSTIVEREGDSVVRTPDGPQRLSEIMADVDQTYFSDRHEFTESVRGAIGDGPVPTEN
ncbi:DUF5789 family protein [Haloarcula nitratireducens]|uniref:Uncharacterized protein n=1 Tax=Haloarcula nitratireducens TaxID=2487749 RepID=A0AAW4P7G7_9EURY|nr:DUF5789 family protein [Halomicroarcula nitratireducens]MBX0293693.1 hypothetical protein [Halomicroarcula nitratireducens]